ncbi:MAG: D-alanyl-D-alanine carboxypeptidase/D-alanyl-D-alanine-endopeptidase [Phycisphaeraceae bacterium]
MMHTRRSALFFVLLLLTAPAQADLQRDFEATVAAANLGKARWSIQVTDLTTGQTLVSMDADRAVIPASNMKLVTTAAALGTLGPDFVFRTELRLLTSDTGDGGAIVLVKGDGDPGFADGKLLEAAGLDVEKLLAAWVDALRKAGVKRLHRLVIDDRIFEPPAAHRSWPDNQLNAWYCAQVAGLNFHGNCLDLWPRPGGPGQPAVVRIIPAAPFLSVRNTTRSGASGNFIVGRKAGGNDLSLSGGVKHAANEAVNITIDDPPLFFARVLAHRLGAAGIPVADIARADAQVDRLGQGQLVHAVQTTLPAVLYRCNKDSQNLFAEALCKRIGHAATKQPGSWDNGGKAIKAFVGDKVGDAARGLVVSDGSGMSRDNRVTAQLLVALLSAMARDAKLGPAYVQSLSVAGQDGTLHKRLEGLAGEVRGKTGYIAGVSTFSGYWILPEDRPAQRPAHVVAFSLLFNDITGDGLLQRTKALQDKLVTLIDRDRAAAPARAR